MASSALLSPTAPARVDDACAAQAVPLWRDPLFGLTLLLTLFAVAPLLLPGYFWGANDARHHVYFLHQYDRLVQDGIWWPRWSPDFAFGYGYPFFNIYGPFSHFVAELLHHFLGFGFTQAVEAVFGLSIVASAAAMYVCARDWAGRAAGMVSALVYAYLPYHLLNLYVRANLAESMAFVWLPLCLWGVRNAVLRRHAGWIVAIALSYGGLMVTSNLVIVLFSPALGLYLLLVAWLYAVKEDETIGFARRLGRSVKVALWPLAGLAAGLGLSAVFWIPAFLEQRYVRVDQWFAGRYDFRGHFVYLYQLFSPRWGFGVSTPGPDDPISYQIGLAAFVLAVVGVIVAWPRARRQRAEIVYFALAALAAVIAALEIASALWDLPLVGAYLGTAQFPWRWFSVMAPFVALLGGLVVARFPADPMNAADRVNKMASVGTVNGVGTESAGAARLDTDGDTDMGSASTGGFTLGLLALCATVILSSYPYLRVEISEPVEGPISLAALMRFQQSSDEMTGSTAWVKEIPRWSPMADYYISEERAGRPVEPVRTKLDYSVFDYETFGAESVANNSVMEEVYFANHGDAARSLVFNQFYYPGWRAWLLDGRGGARLRELPIIPEETGTLGRMTVAVPRAKGTCCFPMVIRRRASPAAGSAWRLPRC